MLKTTILICSLSTSPSDCSTATALDALSFPPERVVICGLSAQATVARTALKPGPGQYAKIVCAQVAKR